MASPQGGKVRPASASAPKPASPQAAPAAAEKKVRRKKRDYSNFQSFIYRIMKSDRKADSKELGFTTTGMTAMNGILLHLRDTVVARAVTFKRGKTLSVDAFRSAVMSMYAPVAKGIQEHVLQQMSNAVSRYNSYEAKTGVRASARLRTKLSLPYPRLKTWLRRTHARVSSRAAVTLAAYLEYLIAEIVEISANSAEGDKKKRLTAKHIRKSISNDPELGELASTAVFRDAGYGVPEAPLLTREKQALAAKLLKSKDAAKKAQGAQLHNENLKKGQKKITLV